jgi:hypothetical protein
MRRETRSPINGISGVEWGPWPHPVIIRAVTCTAVLDPASLGIHVLTLTASTKEGTMETYPTPPDPGAQFNGGTSALITWSPVTGQISPTSSGFFFITAEIPQDWIIQTRTTLVLFMDNGIVNDQISALNLLVEDLL